MCQSIWQVIITTNVGYAAYRTLAIFTVYFNVYLPHRLLKAFKGLRHSYIFQLISVMDNANNTR